jgi:hypothetical protein
MQGSPDSRSVIISVGGDANKPFIGNALAASAVPLTGD